MVNLLLVKFAPGLQFFKKDFILKSVYIYLAFKYYWRHYAYVSYWRQPFYMVIWARQRSSHFAGQIRQHLHLLWPWVLVRLQESKPWPSALQSRALLTTMLPTHWACCLTAQVVHEYQVYKADVLLRMKKKNNNYFSLSVNVFTTKVLIGDSILHGHPCLAACSAKGDLHFSVILRPWVLLQPMNQTRDSLLCSQALYWLS